MTFPDLSSALPNPSPAAGECDLGYFAIEWFDWLTDDGFFFVLHLRTRTSLQRLHVFHEQGETLDALVHLGAYRSDRAAHAVRLMQFHQGASLRTDITNVTDSRHWNECPMGRPNVFVPQL